MPFMHSESLLIQDQSVRLFENLGNENNLDYAIKHREVIQISGDSRRETRSWIVLPQFKKQSF